MDDLSEKLSGILSDPEAMKEIAALASQLGVDAPGVHTEAGGTRADTRADQRADTRPETLIPQMPKPDDGTAALLTGLMPMLGSLRQDDDTTRLLEAMRPFLSEERRRKLDRAKRLIRVMKLMPLLKDLPLFDFDL